MMRLDAAEEGDALWAGMRYKHAARLDLRVVDLRAPCRDVSPRKMLTASASMAHWGLDGECEFTEF